MAHLLQDGSYDGSKGGPLGIRLVVTCIFFFFLGVHSGTQFITNSLLLTEFVLLLHGNSPEFLTLTVSVFFNVAYFP